MSEYAVRAIRCAHTSAGEAVEAALGRITDPLERSWAELGRARRIAVKANIVMEPERIRRTAGLRQELVDDLVLRALLRILRRRTEARIFLVDSTYHPEGERASCDIHFLPLLRELGVEYVECTNGSLDWYEVPGSPGLFRRYQLNPCFRGADAVVSVATLKSHAFMGVTLTTKNLFGLCPVHPQNRPRQYFHHVIRLPYVLAELARTLRPCLCVVDGLVGQSGREWGGDARICDTLVAGDNCIATDACAASLMGHDPAADWPAPPFRRDRNHLRVASDAGYGTVDLARIDFTHDLSVPVGSFDSQPTDPDEMVESWRRTMCGQALYYRDHRDEFLRRYAGEYVYLQDGEVLWHDRSRHPDGSRRELAGARKESAIWVKLVDPEEREGERLDVYAEELARMPARR